MGEQKVNRIAEINELIDVMHRHVLADFNKVVGLVKHDELRTSLNGKMAEVVKELQYYDIIHQKLQHIKSINEWVESSEPCEPSGRRDVNLFRLNFLQFQLSYYDYLNAVTIIRQAVAEVERFLVDKGVETAIFERSDEISGHAEQVNEKLLAAERDLAQACAAEVNQNLERLSRLYSMECERAVLSAYLENPAIDPELIKAMSTMIHTADDSIDLF